MEGSIVNHAVTQSPIPRPLLILVSIKGAVNRPVQKLVVSVTDWSQHRGQVPPRQAQVLHRHQGSTQVLHRQAAGFYLTRLYYLTHHSWTSLAILGVKEPWFANKVSWQCCVCLLSLLIRFLRCIMTLAPQRQSRIISKESWGRHSHHIFGRFLALSQFYVTPNNDKLSVDTYRMIAIHSKLWKTYTKDGFSQFSRQSQSWNMKRFW